MISTIPNDLSGYKFGLGCEVIEYYGKENKYIYWLCRCKCGGEFKLRRDQILGVKNRKCVQSCRDCADSLKKGKSNIRKDLLGYKFGKCEVIKNLGTKNGHYKWLVRCECGEEFETFSKCITGDKAQSANHSCQKCSQRERGLKQARKKIGLRFDRLTIVDVGITIGKGKSTLRKYKCLCNCGEITYVDLAKLKSGHTRSCGCIFNEQRGEKHPRWNPNLANTDRENNKRGSFDHTKLRNEVFARDKYTCQITGQTGRLQVHHLDSYDWCVDGRFDPKNCITLLESVHKDFHDRYGRGKNTKEQFQEFIRGYKYECSRK